MFNCLSSILEKKRTYIQNGDNNEIVLTAQESYSPQSIRSSSSSLKI